MVENAGLPEKDPIQRVYEGLAADSRADALSKPHDTETWRYKKRPPLRFRASESGGCPRRLYYRLVGCVPQPESASLKLKQLEGNVAQDVVRQLFLKYGIELGGIRVEPDGSIVETLDGAKTFEVERGDRTVTVRVSARADGSIDTPRGLALLFEFKTITTNSVRWLQVAFDQGGEPKALERIHNKSPWYENQVQITMAVFDGELTYFGHKNKDTTDYGLALPNGERTGLYIAYDREIVDGILREFALVSDAIEAGTPPDLSLCPLDGSRDCGWCPFYYQCYGVAKNDGKVVYPDGK